jgi:hypothetical protein
VTTVGSDFVARLADRAGEAETLRRLPTATIDDISGHVVLDYDVSRELAGALEIGAKVSPFAMI